MDYLTILLWIPVGLVIYALMNCFGKVDKVHYGIRVRLGEQLPGYIGEGWYFKLPFIDEVFEIPCGLQPMNILVRFTTQNKLRIEIPGSLQYKADPLVVMPKSADPQKPFPDEGKNIFFRVSQEAIHMGIEKEVQAKLGALGGKYDAEEFIKNRDIIGDLINSILRLREPLHLYHDKRMCGVSGCSAPATIKPNEVIDFYEDHRDKVKELLDGEGERVAERSEIESRYGIDIATYALADVIFTKETEAALEEKEQAGFRSEAADKTVELAKKIKGELSEIDDQQALNWADAVLNPGTPRRMISVEGKAGVLGALADLTEKTRQRK